MEKHVMHYETLIDVTNAISQSKDPEEVGLITVESLKTALKVKGCSLFLINKKSKQLELSASYGLSENYLSKGPIKHLGNLQKSLEEGPLAIYDVMDDPRIQYPAAANEEGIVSILSIPIAYRGEMVGTIRIYFSNSKHISEEDIESLKILAEHL